MSKRAPILSPFSALGVVEKDQVVVTLPSGIESDQEGKNVQWYIVIAINGVPFEQVLKSKNVEGEGWLSNLSKPLLLKVLEGVFVRERTMTQGGASDGSNKEGYVSVALKRYNVSSSFDVCDVTHRDNEVISLSASSLEDDSAMILVGSPCMASTSDSTVDIIEMSLPIRLQDVVIQQFKGEVCQTTETVKEQSDSASDLLGDTHDHKPAENDSSDILEANEMTINVSASTREGDVKDPDDEDDEEDDAEETEAFRKRTLEDKAKKEAYIKWKTQMDSIAMLFHGIAELAEASGFTTEELKQCYVMAGGSSSLPPLSELDEDTQRFTESKQSVCSNQ